jgi:hypothetical protein
MEIFFFFRILVWVPDILSDDFRDLTQYLQANAGTVQSKDRQESSSKSLLT